MATEAIVQHTKLQGDLITMEPVFEENILLYVNGKRHNVKARDLPRGPYTTLLQFLRAAGLTGTKLGCGEVSSCYFYEDKDR